MVEVINAFSHHLHNDMHGPKKHIIYSPTYEVRLHYTSIVRDRLTNPNRNC